MKNKLKRIFLKSLSIVMAITITIPNLISGYNPSIIVYGCDYSDAEYDAYFELENALIAHAGDWGTAIYQDHINPGYFHDEIIDYIEERSNGLYKGELPIVFSQPVINPTTEKKTSSGRADIYTVYTTEEKSITYLWEVKPASYYIDDGFFDRKSKGEEQLQNYVNSNEFFKNGKDYPDFTPLLWLSGTFYIKAPSTAIYKVRFLPSDSNNGLILYWFQRVQKPRDENEEAKDETENSVEDNVNEQINTSTEEYSFDGTGNIIDSKGKIVISRNKIVFYTGICSTLSAYYAKLIKTKNPPSNAIKGYQICIFLDAAVLSHNARNIVAALAAFKLFIEINDVDCLAAGIEDIEYNESDEERNAESSSSSSSSDDSSTASSESSSGGSGGGSQTSDSVATEDLTSNDDLESEAEGAATDPLILDLDNDGYDINTKGYGSYFDLNCDDFAEKINWTTKDGILALDKNNNGTIDNGNEVFGDYFIMDNGDRAINGFDALKQFDNNADDVIDNNDAIFEKLLIWIDENGNGKTESGELSSVKEKNISKIHLDYVSINQMTGSEAIIGNQSIFEYTDSSTGNIGEMWVSADLFDALELISMEPSKEIAGLPNVRSFGTVNSLHTAMMNDSSGKLQALVSLFTTEKNYSVRTYIVKQILEIMCNAEDVDPASRGAYIDAKHLAVIEAVMGKSFTGQNGVNPNRNAAAILEQVYNNIVNTYCFAMLSSTVYDYIDRIEIIENQDGSKNFQMNDFNMHLLYDFESFEIDYGTFVDICSYVDYFSKVEFGDRRLLICLLEYIYNNNRDLYEAVFPAIYDSINGTSDSDLINGTDMDDFIIAGDGNDTVYGKKGNDYLIGNNGDDNLYGEYNDDYLIGGFGNDKLYGQLGNDQLFGEDGDDMLYGFTGNDVLDGGSGTDRLEGGEGDDTYIFGRGYGNDSIWETSYKGKDKVIFKEDITPDDIILARKDSNMILKIKDSEDSLTIQEVYAYNCGDRWVETFEFADGTIKTIQDYLDTPLTITGEGEIKDFNGHYGTRDAILIGSDKDDSIYGYLGNDTLDGRGGNDRLEGGADGDTYIFGRGYGHDTIYDPYKNTDDKVVFGEGISPDDIILSRNNGSMILSIKDTDDSLQIDGVYSDSRYNIETFEFADGTVKTLAEYLSTSLTITGEGEIKDYCGGNGCTQDAILIGSDNDDSIYGYYGNDTLDGRGGNDRLEGGEGDDTYIFGRGYGNDSIWETSYKGKDKVIFKDDITPDDIIVSRGGAKGEDLILLIKDSDDSLTILSAHAYNSKDRWVETFEFADGTVKTIEEYFDTPLTITGEGVIKDFTGGYGTRDATLIGSDGDDSIYGYYGNDTLDGRGGDDRLEGGEGDDTYIFGRGYGNDSIWETSYKGKDKVVFKEDITPDDIIVSRGGAKGEDLILLIKDSDDSLTILSAHAYNSKDRWVETFEFADGTVKTIEEYFDTPLTITGEGVIKDFTGGYGTRDATLIGSDGDDSIYGYYGNDTLDGRGGNDRLEGGADGDTYIFGLGYGNDSIYDAYRSTEDKVLFGEGIMPDDLELTKVSKNLVISVKDTADSVTIINYFADSSYRVENFEFYDGTVVKVDAAELSFVIIKEGSSINNSDTSDDDEPEDTTISEPENDLTVSDSTECEETSDTSSSEAGDDDTSSEGSSVEPDESVTDSTNDMSSESTDASDSNNTSDTENAMAA